MLRVFSTTDEFLAGLSRVCKYDKISMTADLLQTEKLTDMQNAMDFCTSVADKEGE